MPELTGTLGTSVNGPEGLPLFDGDAWDHVDWRQHEEQVRRLRGRIFKAVQDGDWPLAGNVQKLMVRHEALVRREALGVEGGGRPSRWAVAAAWWKLSAA
jgi:hypothetical protein